MAEVLVLVKVSGGAVSKSTLEALTVARTLGEPSAVEVEAPGTAAGETDRTSCSSAATFGVTR